MHMIHLDDFISALLSITLGWNLMKLLFYTSFFSQFRVYIHQNRRHISFWWEIFMSLVSICLQVRPWHLSPPSRKQVDKGKSHCAPYVHTNHCLNKTLILKLFLRKTTAVIYKWSPNQIRIKYVHSRNKVKVSPAILSNRSFTSSCIK